MSATGYAYAFVDLASLLNFSVKISGFTQKLLKSLIYRSRSVPQAYRQERQEFVECA
jgi:hypothetical protein